ncbi:MAG: SDH family Clp fold serine proteinase [Candidatus Methanofastidiosia archaeon]
MSNRETILKNIYQDCKDNLNKCTDGNPLELIDKLKESVSAFDYSYDFFTTTNNISCSEFIKINREYRNGYLDTIAKLTNRNVIAYYGNTSHYKKSSSDEDRYCFKRFINDNDINGFMNSIYAMDRSKGLVLLLHTDGGEIGATEAIVTYLRRMFGKNIWVIVPQKALSAGTLIACSAKAIIMGDHSCLGPIDPQITVTDNNYCANALLAERDKALNKSKKESILTRIIYSSIIRRTYPGSMTQSENYMEWAKELLGKWLKESEMLNNNYEDGELFLGKIINEDVETDKDTKRPSKDVSESDISDDTSYEISIKVSPQIGDSFESVINLLREMSKKDMKQEEKIKNIVNNLSDPYLSKSHQHHLSIAQCNEIELKIIKLEDYPDLQNAVLSFHHTAMLFFEKIRTTYKLFHSSNGMVYVDY